MNKLWKKNILELKIVTQIRFFPSCCQVMFLSLLLVSWFFDIRTRLFFLYLDIVPWRFFVELYKRKQTFVFKIICSENNSRTRWQLQCYKWYPAFVRSIQKPVFVSGNIYEKYIVRKEHSIVHLWYFVGIWIEFAQTRNFVFDTHPLFLVSKFCKLIFLAV